VCGVEVVRREKEEGVVEWGKMVVDLGERRKKVGKELRSRIRGGRKELEERVEHLDKELLEGVKRNKSERKWEDVTGLFLSNENTIGPAIDLLALVLREASRDRR